MVKRILPPHAYHGPRPDGFKFQRFEETGPTVEGVAHDGQRIIIPTVDWWVKEDA